MGLFIIAVVVFLFVFGQRDTMPEDPSIDDRGFRKEIEND